MPSIHVLLAVIRSLQFLVPSLPRLPPSVLLSLLEVSTSLSSAEAPTFHAPVGNTLVDHSTTKEQRQDRAVHRRMKQEALTRLSAGCLVLLLLDPSRRGRCDKDQLFRLLRATAEHLQRTLSPRQQHLQQLLLDRGNLVTELAIVRVRLETFRLLGVECLHLFQLRADSRACLYRPVNVLLRPTAEIRSLCTWTFLLAKHPDSDSSSLSHS